MTFNLVIDADSQIFIWSLCTWILQMENEAEIDLIL